MSLQRVGYILLHANDVGGDKSSEELLGSGETMVRLKSAPYRRLWLVLHLGILTSYTIVFLALCAHVIGKNSKALKDVCLLQQSMYSPAFEAVEYSVVKFNGSLEHPSPYKGPRTPAVDEAWNRITTNNSLRPIRISDDELQKINKAGRASNAKYQEADGGGNMATIEVFHQLHCLNLLRMYTYPKDYPEVQELWKTQPKFLRIHLDHCIDIIRLNLMCNADVTVISYDWVNGWQVPLADFDTYHKCRNFDAILDWVKINRVRIPQDHMTRIGDEIDLPEWHPPD